MRSIKARGCCVILSAASGRSTLTFYSIPAGQHALPIAYTAAGLLLAAWGVMKIFRGDWSPLAVPIAAALVLLARLGDFLVAVRMQAAPTPLLVVVGSFLLFGVGTLTALTKSRWNPPAAPVKIKSNPEMMP